MGREDRLMRTERGMERESGKMEKKTGQNGHGELREGKGRKGLARKGKTD